MSECNGNDCNSGTHHGVLCVLKHNSCKHCPKMLNVTIPIIKDSVGNLIKVVIVDISSPTLGPGGPYYKSTLTPTVFLIDKNNYRTDYVLTNDDCFSFSKDKNGYFSVRKNQPGDLLNWVRFRLGVFMNKDGTDVMDINHNKVLPSKYAYWKYPGVSSV